MRVGSLRTKGAFLGLILLLSLLCQLTLISLPAMAQVVPAQITDFQITTQDDRPVVAEELLASYTYKVHFTIDVAANVSGKVSLTTGMERDGDRYWSLAPGENYAGIDLNTWQPGQANITFDPVQGKVSFVLEGHIPDNYTTEILVTQAGSQETLHFAQQIVLLELSVGDGDPLDIRSAEVIDASIQKYQDTLVAKQGLRETVETEPAYAALVTSIIDQAKQEKNAGRIDRAQSLLETIPNTGWVPLQEEDSESSDVLFFIIIAVLGVIAVVAIVLLLRGKSETQFLKRRADDEARKLDLISARINRIGETSIADEIHRVKDSLDAIRRGR